MIDMIRFVLTFSILVAGFGHGLKKVCKIDNLDYINYSNIVKLTGCTKVVGDMKILEATFNGDQFLNLPALHPGQLNVFKTVTEITGVVVIQGQHKDFKDLSFLGNLTTVYGRKAKKYDRGAALAIGFTSIDSLNLSSLKSIRNGNVTIAFNERLCYAESINFRKLFRKKSQEVLLFENRPAVECALSKKTCATVCDDNGCWGPGRENCVGAITETNIIEHTSK